MTAVLTEEKTSIIEEYDQHSRRYRLFAEEIEHLVKNILAASNINYNSVVSRVKERDSLAEKLIENKESTHIYRI